MSLTRWTRRARQALLAAAVLLAGAGLLTFPQECALAGRQGLALCAEVIVPSLFPFFVLSSLVVELGLADRVGRALRGLMGPLFRVGGAGASALVLGLVGGYPVGARTAIGLYESGQCSREETLRLLAFCNNSGPAFILGVVGIGVFGSGRVGLLLYLIHAAASLCVGLVFRFWGGGGRTEGPGLRFRAVRLSRAFTRSVTGAAQSLLHICAFVVLFTVLTRLLLTAGLLDAASRLLAGLLSGAGVGVSMARQLLYGLLEVTTGVTGLRGMAGAGRLPLAAFLLGWAGLSVHSQVLSFLDESGLPAGTYLAGKGLHGAISALLTALLIRWMPGALPAGGWLARQVENLVVIDVRTVLIFSILCAGSVTALFWAAARPLALPARKKGGNRRRKGV